MFFSSFFLSKYNISECLKGFSLERFCFPISCKFLVSLDIIRGKYVSAEWYFLISNWKNLHCDLELLIEIQFQYAMNVLLVYVSCTMYFHRKLSHCVILLIFVGRPWINMSSFIRFWSKSINGTVLTWFLMPLLRHLGYLIRI